MVSRHRFTVWQIYGDEWSERTGVSGDDLLSEAQALKLAKEFVSKATKYYSPKQILVTDSGKVIFSWTKTSLFTR